MSEDRILGGFELLLLLAILRLRDGAYGVTIRAELAEKAGREVAVGAIYTALDRLEQKAYVASHLADPTPERGGRAKRLYRVTSRGLAAIRESQTAVGNLMDGLVIGAQPA